MLLPLASSPCADDELTCQLVDEWTGNSRWAAWSDVLIGRPLAIIGLILLGAVVRWVLHRITDRVADRAGQTALLERLEGPAAERRAQRAGAMAGVVKSGITVVLIAMFATMILSELGINIAPIIASAGIAGIALGFGAQSLVKDFLAGIFIFVEDQYGVGDVVDVGEAVGTVEAVTLRMTRLRDIHGVVWYVPNGEILRVGNQSQNWSRAVIDVGVAYNQDLARAERVLRDIGHDLWTDEDHQGVLIEEPEVTGVEMLAADSVTLRIMVKTAPSRQWEVARDLRQRIKNRFDYEGIEIPFPQRVVWLRDDQRPAASGSAATAESGASESTEADAAKEAR